MSLPTQVTGRPEKAAVLIPKRSRTVPSNINDSDTVFQPHQPKRQKLTTEKGTLEISELFSEVPNISESDVPQPVIDKNPSEKDVRYMKQAFEVAKNSPDENTKVGAIIVDPLGEKVLGKGWNRMPKGCEDRFSWSRVGGDCNILKTKYPYVIHGVKAAILDALKKKHSDLLEGATLYSTLIPDNKDSQMIREVGITRVVYRDDTFSKFAFAIASKKILKGLDWRQIVMPSEKGNSGSDSD